MNRIISIVSLGLLLMLGLNGHSLAASITASVDRNPVSLDESFNLRLKAKGSVDGEPDLSVLQQDFEILGTSQSTSMNFVNGNFSREAVWNVSLISKAAGDFTIPSISFGKDVSPALRITVKPGGSSGSQQADNSLFLEVETDVDSTWVQAQIIYTVRLFRNVSINNASLSAPATSDSDAIIEKLGDDVSYEAFRNGVRFDVTERRYAIFPQKSGTLEIQPARFEGRVGQRRSLFDSMSNSTVKRARSDSLTIEVKPVPAGTAIADWLPAGSIELEQEWSTGIDQLEAGEPVTRTIVIRAEGLLANQLPDIVPVEVDQLKQYADQPQTNNRIDAKGTEAIKQIKIAMIPSRAGSLRLPEVRLPWWNTVTGSAEVAVLPAVTLTVTGEAANTATPGPASSVAPATRQAAPATSAGDNSSPATAGASSFWPWLSLLLAAGWLLTLYLFWRQRRAQPEREPDLAELRRRLLQNCQQNDAVAAKTALLAWARAYWPEQRMFNLMDIIPQVETPLADAIRELNSLLYSEHRGNWQGRQLARLIEALPATVPAQTIDISLIEPLYRS